MAVSELAARSSYVISEIIFADDLATYQLSRATLFRPTSPLAKWIKTQKISAVSLGPQTSETHEKELLKIHFSSSEADFTKENLLTSLLL